MSKTKKGRGAERIEEIDLRLDGLLGKLGGTLSELMEKLEAGEAGEIRRSHEVQTPRGPLKAETGIRVRLGGVDLGGGERRGTGRRVAEPVNAPQGQASEAAAPSPRTVVPATHVADGRWVLSAELPGVTLDEVRISLDGGSFFAETTGAKAFRLSAALPAEVDPGDMHAVMRNGILEVSLGLSPKGGDG